MKKRLNLFILSTILTTTLQAGSMNYGITSSKFADGDRGYGFEMGTDWFFYRPKNLNGFGVGFAGDMTYFTLGDIESIDDDAGMLINLDLTTGFEKNNISGYIGVGYGVGMVGSTGFDGLNYQASLSYDFNEKSGIGIKYNHNDCDINDLGLLTVDLDIVSIYYKHKLSK
jgi:hypothetical protein